MQAAMRRAHAWIVVALAITVGNSGCAWPSHSDPLDAWWKLMQTVGRCGSRNSVACGLAAAAITM